ncbi:hypothetical protein B0T25DRAFT_548883 [Lasiosphaeria hispida]|uniref:HNH nuclease domain-containing protein n=1 Tax=Lasiosphaeria hispida TaxID=260671 RepID=A0AAJ0HF87_9PEZI|nr:hypothetical protein B0T25DRAFT_548883 [Lasiosphaeria hispida]
MVSLSPQLHIWWGNASFGFKCLGILPSRTGNESLIRVQFHWMPRAIALWRQDQRDEHDLRIKTTNDRSPLVEQGVAAFRLSARPLTTGDIFDIPIVTEDAKKVEMASDLQWALIRIAALSGAADVDEVGAEDDSPAPPDGGLMYQGLRGWLEGLDTTPSGDA